MWPSVNWKRVSFAALRNAAEGVPYNGQLRNAAEGVPYNGQLRNAAEGVPYNCQPLFDTEHKRSKQKGSY